MWWDDARIEETVTRQFVCEHLAPDEAQRLDLSMGFGDGLTDDTYWDWLEQKAKKLFLLLLDLGIPSRIFSIIDDSWDDNDLPIGLEQLECIGIGNKRDEKLARRFYARQFHYLIQFMGHGAHIDYSEVDVVPVTVVDKRNNFVDRVELANRPGDLLLRRRVPLGTGPGCWTHESFMSEVERINGHSSNHLMSYFASYTLRESAYILWSPASEYSLKSLLVTLPGQLKAMDKQMRRVLTMNWIHCLIDSICYLHNTGRSHGHIRPSTILFDARHDILYADTTQLSPEAVASASDRQAFSKESYDYAAPELWYRPSASQVGSQRKNTLTWPTSPTDGKAPFAISRGNQERAAQATAQQTVTPQLNPQAADIFSLGCVILELLTLQMKRQSKSFTAHRAAKHKMAGRGGAVPDSSFHKNLGQVESWMAGLAKDASKKDDTIFRGVKPTLQLVARMLAVNPQERPTAQQLEQTMYDILTQDCEIHEPHCVHQYYGVGGLNIGMGRLRVGQESNVIVGQAISTRDNTASGYYTYGGGSSGSGGRPVDDLGSPISHGRSSSGGSSIGSQRRNKFKPWQPPVRYDSLVQKQAHYT